MYYIMIPEINCHMSRLVLAVQFSTIIFVLTFSQFQAKQFFINKSYKACYCIFKYAFLESYFETIVQQKFLLLAISASSNNALDRAKSFGSYMLPSILFLIILKISTLFKSVCTRVLAYFRHDATFHATFKCLLKIPHLIKAPNFPWDL